MMRPSRALFGALALSLIAAACDDGSTAPEAGADVTADIADLAAEAALADLEILTGIMAEGFGPAAAPGDHGPGHHGMGGGVTSERTRTLEFFDESGIEMEGYDPLLTARIERTSSLTREIAASRVTASHRSERALTVSGLLGEETERTFDGTGSDQTDRAVITRTDETRTWAMEGSMEIRSVVRAIDRVAHPWPLSGSIAREITVTGTDGANGDVTRTRSTLITFDGTQFATLVVNGETFIVDLAEPRGSATSTRERGHGGR